MRVLVTGRHGQVARALAERGAAHPGVELVFASRPGLDLERPASLARAVDSVAPDVVVNCAAFTAVDAAEDEPERALRVNGIAPGVLASAARRADARMVQISTDYVFDGASTPPYGEDDPVGPRSVYGLSKLAGEQAVRAETADHVIVRTAWLHSPFGRNFVQTMLDLAERRERLDVVDDQRGSPTSALDVADGLYRLLVAWDAAPRAGLGQTYHLAGDGEATWFQVACHALETSRSLGGPSTAVRPVPSTARPSRAPRPMDSRLLTGKFARDFGYRCPPWRESVARTVRRLLEVADG